MNIERKDVAGLPGPECERLRWLKEIAPENRLALTFLHTPFNSPLVMIDASDEATDAVLEDCRRMGSDASDFPLPEPFDGFGLFRAYGEFIPRATFETRDLPTYRLHKIVKLMGDCEINNIFSRPSFFYSATRAEAEIAQLREDLRLNAAMLGKQCDRAMDAETPRAAPPPAGKEKA